MCGGYNSFLLKKAISRVSELKSLSLSTSIVCVGIKGSSFFARRSDQFKVVSSFKLGGSPTTTQAQLISDVLTAEFLTQRCEKVEMIYTRFNSLISSTPII